MSSEAIVRSFAPGSFCVRIRPEIAKVAPTASMRPLISFSSITVQSQDDRADSIWMADHLIDIDGAIADPYAVFGYLAAVTQNVFFCAAVSDCQRIHPSKMAHMIATLDEITHGRIGLGIGAGLILENTFVTAFRVRTHIPIVPIDRFDNLSKIAKIHCPVLIMHSLDDEIILPWHGEALFEKAALPKQSLWIEEAGHGGIPFAAPTRYRDALLSFARLLDSQSP